jgi:glycine dehydrogenase subunit 1
MRFLPHTEDEIRSMLATIGVPSIDALFAPIPENVRLGRPLAIDKGIDEASLMRHLEELANKSDAQGMLSFLGAGIYAHHTPPAVDQLLLRGEFMTAYTPYQAEVAQGTLQAIFEFQTIVSELFGLPVANASMYDGASATAEAVLMARRITKRNRVLLSTALHPEYASVVTTYLRGLDEHLDADDAPRTSIGTIRKRDMPLGTIDRASLTADGRTDLTRLEAMLSHGEYACVVIGQPNVLGVVEDVRAIAEVAHKHGALLVTATPETYALSIVEAPGAQGADICVGEGQPLGISPQLGGPGVGLFACREGREFLTNLPGRLVGETVDSRGHRGYVLTLSTREQHIRRERATSNICTNHSLCALALTIRMCLLGKRGFVESGTQCHAKAEYLKRQIAALPGYSLPYAGPTFNEFVVRRHAGEVAPMLASLQAKKILAGVDLGRLTDIGAEGSGAGLRDKFVVAVTEKHTRGDLDALVAALASA